MRATSGRLRAGHRLIAAALTAGAATATAVVPAAVLPAEAAVHEGNLAASGLFSLAPSGSGIPVAATYSQPSNTADQLIRIPIPDGIRPTRVTGRLVFDSNVAGTVAVLTRGAVVAHLTKRATTTRARVSFPVRAADVSNGFLQFSLRYLTGGVTDPAKTCLVSSDGNVQLSHVSVGYRGAESTPTTLGQFFDQSVRAVSIVTPRHPSSDVAAAALAAASAVSHRYARGVRVTVTTPDDATRAVPVAGVSGGRQISIEGTTGAPSARIDDSANVHRLTLAGDPARLAAAAAALGSPLLKLADVATSTPLSQTGHLTARSTLTLADLGQPAPVVQGLGESQFAVTARQSDFGSAVRTATVHLVGEHTAVPSSISALLQYRWNGQLIGSEVLGSSTKIDKTFTIPASKIAVGNTLSVQLNAIPTKVAEGSATLSKHADCSGSLSTLPVAVDFDGKASSISVRGGTTGDPGFSRFPQVLGNDLTVALGNDSADTLSDAAAVVSELQFANSAQLSVRLSSPQAFMASSAPGLLAGASPAQMDQLHAPLRMASFRSIDQDDINFGAGVDKPFAALEAWYQNGRNILALSSWSPQGQDATSLSSHLTTWLAHSRFGWPALFDNIAVAQSTDAKPALVDGNALVPQAKQVRQFQSYIYWVAAFVAVVVLMWLVQLVARRRLRRRAAQLVDAQQAGLAADGSGTGPATTPREPVEPVEPGDPDDT